MKRRRIGWLLGSWVAYWAVLFAVKLGPAVAAIWRATHSTSANDNNVTVNMSNLVLNLGVIEHGVATYSGSIHIGALAAWIAVVPLAIWVAWLVSTQSERPAREAV